MLLRLSLMSVFLLFVNCGGKRVNVGPELKVTKGNMSLWATWVKDKKRKWDIQMNLTNNNKNDVVIALGDISCYRGNEQGILKHTFFNTGERTIDLRAGEMKSFNMVCDNRADTDGDFKIVINRVFENPNHDGKTRGKLVVENLTWQLSGAN